VIISPYEYQLRANATLPAPGGDIFLPQRVVSEYLKSKGIDYVDATAAFKRAGVADKSKLFLRFDPMHFSAAGHQVMYDVIRSVAIARGARVY
jgi:lysophospholipase L1-like esterase